MAFPTIDILDDFNRANTGPPPSVNWTTGVLGGSAGFKVASNRVVASNSTNGDGYWNVKDFGPDTETYITMVTGFNSKPDLYLRLANIGTGSTDGYFVDLNDTASQSFCYFRIDNGVSTQLGSFDAVGSPADGDKVGFKIAGNVLTSHYKAAGGSWATIGTRTDSTYSAAGKTGFGSTSGNSYDDFGGGDPPPPVMPETLSTVPRSTLVEMI